MWNYEVSGKQAAWHWFSYRKRDRSKPIIGDRRPPSPLDQMARIDEAYRAAFPDVDKSADKPTFSDRPGGRC